MKISKDMKYKDSIEQLKKERNAIILAHVYQPADVQDIADYTGDSLYLSKRAISKEVDVIVFCGARFMAESAAILNPDKKILLPDENAGCPLADMATVEQLIAKKKEYPDAVAVSYVNSSAAVKAKSDICCTSANAVDVVKSLPQKQILFIPDRNLGSHVAERTDKEIILWENGYCYVHEENINPDKIEELKDLHHDAAVMVHPECNSSVRKLADYIGSTSQMFEYAKKLEKREIIVGTEDGFAYTLQKENPDKKFYPLQTVCKDMKLIDLEKIKLSLERMKYEVCIPEETRNGAKNALDRMLYIHK